MSAWSSVVIFRRTTSPVQYHSMIAVESALGLDAPRWGLSSRVVEAPTAEGSGNFFTICLYLSRFHWSESLLSPHGIKHRGPSIGCTTLLRTRAFRVVASLEMLSLSSVAAGCLVQLGPEARAYSQHISLIETAGTRSPGFGGDPGSSRRVHANQQDRPTVAGMGQRRVLVIRERWTKCTLDTCVSASVGLTARKFRRANDARGLGPSPIVSPSVSSAARRRACFVFLS